MLGLATLLHTTGDFNLFPLAAPADSSPSSPATSSSVSSLALVCEPLCTALLSSVTLEHFLALLQPPESYLIITKHIQFDLITQIQNSATVHNILQILLHTCRNSVEVSEAVAHCEGRTRTLTQLLTSSPPLPHVDQSMLLLLLGAILAQVPWAAELYVLLMQLFLS